MASGDRIPIQDQAALGEFWDALVQGAPRSSHPHLAPTVIETLHRLRALDDTRAPDPVFVQRLERQLLGASDAPAWRDLAESAPRLTAAPNGRIGAAASPLSAPRRLPQRRPWLATLATAALIVLVLTGSFFALGSHRLRPEQEAPVVIPAIVGTPEASPLPAGVTEDTILFQQRIDEIPASASWAGVERITLAPKGTVTQGKSATAGVGPTLYRVEQGTVSIQADGPTTVTRAGTTNANSITPGTAVELGVDDVVFTPSEVVSTWRNTGPGAAVLLDAGIQIPGGEPPAGSGETYVQPINDWPVTPPTAPVELTVHRLKLAPGGNLPHEPEPGLKLVGVDAGTLTFVQAKRADPTVETGRIQFHQGSWTDLSGGIYTAKELRNDGIEPLTLLLMTVIPLSESTSTPVAIPFGPPDFTATTLLEARVPGGMLSQPTQGSNIWLFQHYAIQPKEQITYTEDCDRPDLVMSYVLNGTYAVKPTGSLEVIHRASAGADATQESIAPGQEILLQAGDALVYHNTSGGDYAGFRNPGPDRLELLEWDWLEQDCLYVIPGGMDLHWNVWTRWGPSQLDRVPFDPTSPFTVRFRQMNAAAGTELPQDGPNGPGFLPPGVPGLEVAGAESGTVQVADNAPIESYPAVGTEFAPMGGVVTGAADFPAGVTRTIRSTGEDPLILYTLTITNTDVTSMATPNAADLPEETPMG